MTPGPSAPTVSATLDKPTYRPGDTAILTVTYGDPDNTVERVRIDGRDADLEHDPLRLLVVDAAQPWTRQADMAGGRMAVYQATVTASSTVTVMVTDSTGLTATKTLTLTVEATSGLLVGAACNVPDRSLASFKAAEVKLGPLRIRRSFPQASAGVPIETAIIRAAEGDYAGGYVSFLSAKPPLNALQMGAIAKGIPDGTYFTQRHEPQNDMRAAEFVAEYRRCYAVVKSANPKILMGPVDLAYAWRNRAGVGNAGLNTGPLEPPSAWDPGEDYKDFTGIDIYAADGVELAKYERFQLWLTHNLQASSKPLAIVEYGQVVIPPGGRRDPAREARRAQVISADAAYLPTIDRLAMWLYWGGTGKQGDWFPYDSGSQQAWRDVAAAGRTA